MPSRSHNRGKILRGKDGGVGGVSDMDDSPRTARVFLIESFSFASPYQSTMSRVPENPPALRSPMGSSLRDELASLRIERSETIRPKRNDGKGTYEPYRRGGGGLRLLSWLLWLIPLGIVSTAGAVAYRQY